MLQNQGLIQHIGEVNTIILVPLFLPNIAFNPFVRCYKIKGLSQRNGTVARQSTGARSGILVLHSLVPLSM